MDRVTLPFLLPVAAAVSVAILILTFGNILLLVRQATDSAVGTASVALLGALIILGGATLLSWRTSRQ